MSVMDKLINAMKFNEDPYDDENEAEDTEYYDEEPEKTDSAFDKEDEEMAEVENSSAGRNPRRRNVQERESAPSQRPSVKRQYSESGMEVCIIKPTSVNDAREVTDTLLANSTVVLNLEGLDVEIAQRIIDFTSGSCYAVHGNVMKISHYIFVITPANVDVSGDISTHAGIDRGDSSTLSMPYGGRN